MVMISCDHIFISEKQVCHIYARARHRNFGTHEIGRLNNRCIYHVCGSDFESTKTKGVRDILSKMYEITEDVGMT